ncbi:FKBP-type peptidyl-prolyl cis-trans isomerase [Pseudarthrobacter sulfonivorans]|uniref:FKBP-type peptidyl-prolyl cis-trans isomerase n=1 Tax=Pseudarthrobacter sulfonivorans TaxID=121292 RepID=UPI0027815858|nr:FKBP-type peptidyl-prolyl cis-trans isomerase [Pseudarthrobacter sulfonivorans]MDP9996607.1 peptidylprolyl isomerase [Pseudarthrobacter sulfonivorans]
MRRLLAILLPGLLLLTACGGTPAAPEPTSQSAGDTAKFDSLKLTDNGDKKAPGVEFTKPLEVTEPTIKVVTEGNGDRVKANQVANFSYLAVNGTDGSTLEDTFPTDPEALELSDDLKTGNPIVYNAFVGAKIGSTLALAAPGQSGAEGAAAQPTQLLLIKLVSATDVTPPLEKPEGETVTPPAGLPTVTENDQGVPEISLEGAATPTALVAQDLIKGNGPEVKATDTVVVNYVLYSFNEKKQLESSFTSQPLTSPLSGLIQGWQEGLAGKTVGSRVLLSIPADKAYGAEKGDLVFVVDILGVR